MHKPIIFLLLFWAVAIAQGTPLPEKTKKDIIESGIPSCLLKQKNSAKYLTKAQLYEYCHCSMATTTDLLTLEDLNKYLQTKDTKYFLPATKKAELSCRQKLMPKWGTFQINKKGEYTFSPFKIPPAQ